MEQEQQTICPWCMTEIVWDEEIGPEKHCPHCDNELSGYRTLQIGLDQDDQAEDEDEEDTSDEPEWDAGDEDESYGGNGSAWKDTDQGFRHTNRAWMAVEETLRRVVDEQEEAPECPSCREYMIEAGKQKLNVEPTVHGAVGRPLVQSPIETTLYVCPSCFNTSSILSDKDRERMLKALSPQD
ncbi:hypothetical protein [Paenibacillus radicis (ex Gao et al. 2016)]|uniref:Uncharacterized protein n=1 Tax=Paenibacillus radicis (ex Gao et al. 2016) TaxID=1737354 RepID=A0A917HU96_9BACL|nr:hypothetical protein [Paenibacillus radicis (ex Gao et al. 2016)]GGG90858.1 hypothetical protein GCM10010918_57350 [Paenibacillus radicis (ex Gao et al. 2016)]